VREEPLAKNDKGNDDLVASLKQKIKQLESEAASRAEEESLFRKPFLTKAGTLDRILMVMGKATKIILITMVARMGRRKILVIPTKTLKDIDRIGKLR
jgi:hypothetical protein